MQNGTHDTHMQTEFLTPLSKNKAPTFSKLYETTNPNITKQKVVKADRNIMQRLITAYEAKRPVDIKSILKHELLPVPIALALTNETLRPTQKSQLIECMTKEVNVSPILPTDDDPTNKAGIIIDGQALIISIGKPPNAATFGDLADVFKEAIMNIGRPYSQIDLVFDRYDKPSIKDATRIKRPKGQKPIRRVIESSDVPLPQNWSSFMALNTNKADLARFLCNELKTWSLENKVLVLSGGFLEATEVWSNDPSLDTYHLRSSHEEADTRVILHCVNNACSRLVIQARDTDILVLLIYHRQKIPSKEIWMKAGTSKKQRYIPVHKIYEKLQSVPSVIETIVPFHALTGCDTTSQIGSITKTTAWKHLQTSGALLVYLGVTLTDAVYRDAELFVCKLYGLSDAEKCDKARTILFLRSKATEKLPHTSNALKFHIMRSHYQALVWRNAHVAFPQLPEPLGWRFENGIFCPILKSLPAIPESCLDVIICGCKTNCSRRSCRCRKGRLRCTAACKCREHSDTCMNNE